MIYNNLFSNINVLEKAMNASWLKNEVIANNIANGDTPGYKRRDVSFEQLLQKAVEDHPKTKNINLKDIEPKIVTDQSQAKYRLDENNVDIDKEMVELSKNYIRYNTLMNEMSNNFSRIKMVLNSK